MEKCEFFNGIRGANCVSGAEWSIKNETSYDAGILLFGFSFGQGFLCTKEKLVMGCLQPAK